MANKIDERLLDSFREVSGSQTDSQDDLRGVADELTKALGGPAADGTAETGAKPAAAAWGALTKGTSGEPAAPEPAAAQGPAKATWNALTTGMTPEATGPTAGTQRQSGSDLYGESGTAVGSSVHSSGTTGTSGGSGSEAESVATSLLGGGGVLSLVGGLIGLFSGGSSAPPALEKYQMPSSISFESASKGGGLSASDFDQMGTPRMYSSATEAPQAASGGSATAANSSAGAQGGGVSGGGGSAAAPQISVTVQTMDAQSFLDNSDQIAQAVRGAMLNLSSINDVVNEL